jgi:hypothetical protein
VNNTEPNDIKVYVAGKFQDRLKLREVMAELRGEGFTVTHDWTFEDEGSVTKDELPGYLRKCALLDLQGVRDANFVLLFGHPELKGALIEAGAALALGTPVLVIDVDKCAYNIFTRLFVPMQSVSYAVTWMREVVRAARGSLS